ncbi:MAG TPA: hypothetical protein VFG03_16695 [Telluria sp.]|jgi:hypothetical protein|nr:hypothetical protein [Telluria sp.]
MFKLLRKILDGAMAGEFNTGYETGYDHGHADGHAHAEVQHVKDVAQRLKEERDVVCPRMNFAEGWRYGALFAQENSALGMPELSESDPAYTRGWRAGFTWYRGVTKDLVLPS